MTKSRRKRIADSPFRKKFNFKDGDLPHWVLFDEFGRLIRHQNSFLIEIAPGLEPSSIDTYSGKLLDYERVRSAAHAGKGAPWPPDDAFLGMWSRHLSGDKVDKLGRATGNRGVVPETHNDNLRIILESIENSEEKGYCRGAIGVLRDGFPRPGVVITKHGDVIGHDLFKPRRGLQEVVLPSHADFELVEAEFHSIVKDPVLRKRNDMITLLIRKYPFRGAELLRLTCSQIPSAEKIKRAIKSGKNDKLMRVKIFRLKRGGWKTLHMSPHVLLELREFIDKYRVKQRIEPGVDEIFISAKTGKAFGRPAFTNSYKLSSHRAAENNLRDEDDYPLEEMHPHHNKHRTITDYGIEQLISGVDFTEAMLKTADHAGLSIGVAQHYIHIAHDALQEQSPENVQARTRHNVDALEMVKRSRLRMTRNMPHGKGSSSA